MTVEFNSSGLLAKVTAISEDECTAYIDFRSGKSGSFNTIQQRFTVGDVLLISGDIENNIGVELTKMSGSAWPDKLWVGVVKIKRPDITVIHSGGQFERSRPQTQCRTTSEILFTLEKCRVSVEFFQNHQSRTSIFRRLMIRSLSDFSRHAQTSLN